MKSESPERASFLAANAEHWEERRAKEVVSNRATRACCPRGKLWERLTCASEIRLLTKTHREVTEFCQAPRTYSNTSSINFGEQASVWCWSIRTGTGAARTHDHGAHRLASQG